MTKIRLVREISVPDPVKLERYRRSPMLGPVVLFFSGGTALRDTTRSLVNYTHNSIHIITPFDSGGSSAKLRRAFEMPAIGDIRNRLMALADRSLSGNPEVVALFAHRFLKDEENCLLREALTLMALGKDPLVAAVHDPMRKIIRNHLYRFLEIAPKDFDLRGASIGNLVLTAGYLDNRRSFDPVIYIFTKLVNALGIVRPVVNRNLHLLARLSNGEIISGQHRLTGKEETCISSPVDSICLVESENDHTPYEVHIRRKVARLVERADLICYPMGSFYSSIIANFLPRGVGKAVAGNPCPKVYIPSTGHDPEAIGLSLSEKVKRLSDCLKKDDPASIATSDVLGWVILDSEKGSYGTESADMESECRKISEMGVGVLDCRLVSEKSTPFIDPELLTRVLLSFT